MHFRTAFLAVPLALLGACTSAMGPIIPTGEPNQYTLTSRAGSRTTSWVQLKSDALDRAKQYCQSQGQKMTKPEVASNHATGPRQQVTYVTFNCEPIPQPKSQDGGDAKP
ncbi:hypothetical protein [Bordetella flabilis]|uniref:DUF4156 domain-containing protein n=1 Tax=Bordetella flabilis TaxID=463014 RepID=A0A193GFX9_9BORD|nr:hypothetical protein [Bordetella flabilis]ANN78503.1 hypothetical protein BAU07_16560 [Bordetella flabilis]